MTALKAILGGIVAALGALQFAYEDLSVTQAEWINVVLVGLAAFNAVYFAVNAVKPSPPAPTPEPPQVVVVQAPAASPAPGPVDVGD